MPRTEYREPPISESRPISSLLMSRDRYDVDRTYQRAPGLWTKKMKQYLIDTILRGYCIPPIVVHKRGDKLWVVDGQQRWNTIIEFAEDKLDLNGDYSSDIIAENDGKTKFGELKEYWQNRFNSYPLTLYRLEDYSDEEIRSTYLRLQESKPLTPGERLNAYPGDIVLAMRKLGGHEFLQRLTRIGINRYRDYKLAATFLYLEREGVRDISPDYLYEFFRNRHNLSEESSCFRKVKRTLDYLKETFSSGAPELDSEAWVISTYILASNILERYAVRDNPKILRDFITEFYSKVERANEIGERDLLDFREAVTRSTTKKEVIEQRKKIMLERFVERYNPPEFDEDRLFTDAQKQEIFRRDEEKCQICGCKLEFNDEKTHFHHKKPHILGGTTTVDNGMLVCRDCHLRKIHGDFDRTE